MEKWPTLLVIIDEVNQKKNKRNDKGAIFSSRIKETVRKMHLWKNDIIHEIWHQT